MTDEHDAGFYLKRARTAEMTFGDAAWHRDRWRPQALDAFVGLALGVESRRVA